MDNKPTRNPYLSEYFQGQIDAAWESYENGYMTVEQYRSTIGEINSAIKESYLSHNSEE